MKYAFYKIVKVSKLERNLFFKAYSYSFRISILLLLFSFNKLSSRLGKINVLSENVNEQENKIITEIVHAVKRSAKYSLWRNKCLEQAITAKKMLQQRGIVSTLYLGVRKADEKIDAHAWLKIGDCFVIGEKQQEKYTVVAFYT